MARVDPKCLVKLSFVVLLDTERRDEVDRAIEKDQAI